MIAPPCVRHIVSPFICRKEWDVKSETYRDRPQCLFKNVNRNKFTLISHHTLYWFFMQPKLYFVHKAQTQKTSEEYRAGCLKHIKHYSPNIEFNICNLKQTNRNIRRTMRLEENLFCLSLIFSTSHTMFYFEIG